MKTEQKFTELASKIVQFIGGKGNVLSLSHCVTRLRFVLKDESIVDEKSIKALPIIGVSKQGGQYQVIIGSEVKKVYDACIEILPSVSEEQQIQEKKKSWFSRLLDTLSGILAGIIVPVIGGGMLKGILFFLTNYSLLSAESDIYLVLNIASDCMFYFLPFLVAVSAAKKFKVNEYMSLALAAAMMYPTLVNGAADKLEPLQFGFLQLPYIDYKTTIIPIILAVWIMKYVYGWLEDHIPSVVSSIFTPLITLVIMVPFELIFIAPLGYYGGNYLAYAVDYLVNLSPLLAGFFIAAVRPVLVFTGMHHATRPIIFQQIATNGYTTVSPINYCSTIAQATACLAMYFVVRNSKEKQLTMSTSVSGFLGITEPGLYGVIMKYKPALIGTVVGGGIGGMVASVMGAKAYGSSMPSILTLPVYAGGGYLSIICGVGAAVISTFLITVFLSKTMYKNDGEEVQPVSNGKAETEKRNVVYIGNPVSGTYVALKDVKDKVFSDGLMGPGYAVLPAGNEIKAPLSGKITTLMNTNHAFGIVSEDGIEVLVHVGIDTCKLEGKHFKPLLKQGDTVNKGDTVLVADLDAIRKAGYDITTEIIITNSDEYEVELLPCEKELTLKDNVLKVGVKNV